MGNQVDLLWEEPCGRVSPLGEDLALYLGNLLGGWVALPLVHVGEDPPLDLEQGMP